MNDKRTSNIAAYPKRTPRVTQSVILGCACGGKYIKTRPGQKQCVACLAKAKREG